MLLNIKELIFWDTRIWRTKMFTSISTLLLFFLVTEDSELFTIDLFTGVRTAVFPRLITTTAVFLTWDFVSLSGKFHLTVFTNLVLYLCWSLTDIWRLWSSRNVPNAILRRCLLNSAETTSNKLVTCCLLHFTLSLAQSLTYTIHNI